MSSAEPFQRPPFNRKTWTSWSLLAVVWLLGQLPWRMLLLAGRGIGHLAWHLARSRRLTALTNIRLCFPELSPEAQRRLARASVISTGEALTEMAGGFCNHRIDLAKRLEIVGLENLLAPQREGRGVLMLGMHFNTIDIGTRLLGNATAFSAVYRPNDNPVLDWFIATGRARHLRHCLDRSNIRGLVRLLKAGEAVWYAPDQDYGLDHAVFAPFFGVSAATITATSRIARMGQATVVPTAHYRLPGGRYRIEFGPALKGFPSDDDLADATRINTVIEEYVRKMPEQYLWVHRRFKHAPPGSPSPYPVRRRKGRRRG